jgi:hypothetical protein
MDWYDVQKGIHDVESRQKIEGEIVKTPQERKWLSWRRDFRHRRYLRRACDGTRPAQLPFLLLSIALLLFGLHRGQYLQLLRDKVRRALSASLQNRSPSR